MEPVELGITITTDTAGAARMLAAFARRLKTPELTQEQMLAMLKANAIAQINNVIVQEERAAIAETADAVTPLDLT